MLRGAGVEVVTGVMEKESKELNYAFMTYQTSFRPYIILKWAQSSDGFMDKFRSDYQEPPVRLSSPETMRMVHKLRSEVSAIMVGTHTALLDNPSLTVRHWSGNTPVRIVLDRNLRIPSNFHVLDGSVRTILFTEKEAENKKNVEYVTINFSQSVLKQILQYLYEQHFNSLLVEGGSQLLKSFLSENLWDEARVETTSICLETGVKSPVFVGDTMRVLNLGQSNLKFYRPSLPSKIL